ncbi:MAG: CopD family protein [Azoarcus sp.]|nr:CopD family protein [Azoarcus sp.]
MLMYNTIRILHILFVISWFAGLFYLPRIFVNHAMIEDAATSERLTMMERKLYRFVTPIGVLALVFGVWWWVNVWWEIQPIWLHVKLVLVLVLVAYHLYCGHLVEVFAAGRNRHSHIWYRWFNEIPVLALIAVLVLVVVKPWM